MRRVLLAAALVFTAVCLPGSAHAHMGDPPATSPGPPALGQSGPWGLQISMMGALTLIAADTLLRLAGGRGRR